MAVPSGPIVEHFDVIKDVRSRFCPCRIGLNVAVLDSTDCLMLTATFAAFTTYTVTSGMSHSGGKYAFLPSEHTILAGSMRAGRVGTGAQVCIDVRDLELAMRWSQF